MGKKQAFNPYLPSWEYIPDGEPRIFGDRLYVFGSHDRFNGQSFCLNDYVCWSAPLDDLADWRFEGTIYRANQDPMNTNGKMNLNAPDVIQGPDGRYYLYYQLSFLTCTGVAVCDTPAGKYEFYGYVEKDGSPYGTHEGEPYGFDPGVLVDDDGKVWLYVGFSPEPGFLMEIMSRRGNVIDGCYCIELETDMKTVKQAGKLVLPGPIAAADTEYAGHSFYEASSPRKIHGKYYLVYSSILSHELCYAISDFPDRDYCYGGTLVSIGDVGLNGQTQPVNYTGNTHGGMVQVEDQWYIFYHRQTNKQMCARQACAEKITILPNGTIPQAEITSCGLNLGPLRGKGEYDARIACNLWAEGKKTFAYLKAFEEDKERIHPYFTQSGEDREGKGDQYISNMRNGATAGFKYFSLDCLKSITVRVRGEGNGQMEVRIRPGSEPFASVAIQQQCQWQDFTARVSTEIVGTQALYFTYTGEGYVDFTAFTLE